MHDDRELTEQRLARVLRERLRPAIHPHALPLTVAAWHPAGEPVPPSAALAAAYEPFAPGAAWGPPWGTSWFRMSATVPAEWAGRPVEAVVDLGFGDTVPGFSAEGLVHRPDGTPVKGIHPRNRWIPVADPASGGEEFLVYVEAAANPLIEGPVTALGDSETAGDRPLYRLRQAELAVRDATVWELVQDLEVLDGLMRELPREEPRRWELLRAIGRALDALDLKDIGGSAAAARTELAPALAAPAHHSAHRVTAVGHAHIDSAWLWPLRETVRKVARTTANTLALMDDHPEYVFAMSQAQQYAWLKEHRPQLYERVKKKVAAGQFVPVGGMWVESDVNLPGGEALARQLIHGKRFFLEEFGVECEEVWLPDSFGYSAALPQLIALAGARWFLTQKISWNQTNPFPHHTFRWEGLDGTRIFSHFPSVDTYNSELSGAEMAHAVRVFRDKGPASRSLAPFGYGDGGGGATREMLARAARLRDLEGSPRVAVEPPARFFAAAEREYPDAPVWVGELYFELHRGTYTSQAAMKQGNRRCEHLLREAELWAATAAVRTGHPYPYEQLERLWRTVLLHQFHDILPGSSIAWVHREARQTYADTAAELTALAGAARRALTGAGDRRVVFNAAPHARGGIPAGGAEVAAAPDSGGDPVTATAADGGWVLDNGLLRVTVDGRGLVSSVRHLASGREAVAPGAAANLLQSHPDLPNRWDAWDVDAFYRNTRTDLTDLEGLDLDAGPDAATVRVERRFGAASAVIQTITLAAGSAVVDFTAEVDWHESETFLKAAFPLDIRAADSAAETQFGHVRRATHTNTTWEAAKFEICAHRFLHLSEPGWGAALVNDSTYGHDVTRTVRETDGGTTTTARLSLLRAPRFPDPATDQGRHTFRYALAPGAEITDAVREGYRINLPERHLTGAGPVSPLVTSSNDQVVIEAVKLAEDRSGDVVVRLYESAGGRATTRLTTSFTPASAARTDLLERPQGPADLAELTLRPFEIVTLRLARP
ncbi:alpha-mannosidase [Streptomyces boninensis]|uniref:alpha-mannosidase n=1 Tax=Streptomyces boninensis TaxID=2039455 RepID=UPI003B220613